jgi:chloramphenicol-sensitive protein RarD
MHVVPPLQIMAHRLVWCCVFVLAWLALRSELPQVWAALRTPGVRYRLVVTALLVSTNWLLYVWAVTNGRIVEASLGYFINPLVNVLLGVVLLSERLNRLQWCAVGLAAAGVAYLTWLGGGLPWIALVLALTFGSYGLIRKTVKVEALSGLGAETLLIAPLGAGYLIWCGYAGNGALGSDGGLIDFLLIASGIVTAVPLALFAYGARLIPYSTVGLVQYIGPTLQLLTGVVR